jgi:hypothetical protein
MEFAAFAFGVSALFFMSSLLLQNVGRRIGFRYVERKQVGDVAGLNIIENAVFALIGLLLAFTISGALQRFDERRQQIVQEASAASTAYDRLALFDGDVARDLRAMLKEYVHARIELFREPRHFSPWHYETLFSEQQHEMSLELKARLWDATVARCRPGTTESLACVQALPALANLFEVARLRAGSVEKHPPEIIYIMLFGLGLGGSLLGGFGMSRAKARSWVHMVIFASALTVALYVITDIEFPRMGIIRLDYFDHFLVEAYEQMR